jgi:hypothetical protein
MPETTDATFHHTPGRRQVTPDERRGELDHGQVVARALVVPGGHPAELLEPIHAALDPVALGVGHPVEPRPAALVGPGGDHRADPAAAQLRPHARIRVALVGGQPLRPRTRPTPSGTAGQAGPLDRPGIQQRWQQRGLVPLPGSDQDRQRPPTALDAQVQLAAQPAAAAPQGLILRLCASPLRSARDRRSRAGPATARRCAAATRSLPGPGGGPCWAGRWWGVAGAAAVRAPPIARR